MKLIIALLVVALACGLEPVFQGTTANGGTVLGIMLCVVALVLLFRRLPRYKRGQK